jgi:hypothetical protein
MEEIEEYHLLGYDAVYSVEFQQTLKRFFSSPHFPDRLWGPTSPFYNG